MSYTEEQLDRYFQHINYPREKHAPDRLQLLTELQAHQLARVPFESLTLHYSKHRHISLDLEDLFVKVVVQGKGGYCMELNALFGAVLKGLGFKLTSVGGKIKGDERFGGWSHMLNLVTVDGQRYMVDVGFGKGAAMVPVPLRRDSSPEFTTIAPLRGRLVYERLEQNTDAAQRMWVYYSTDSADGPFRQRNCFTEQEFFPEDFEVMNWAVMSRPTSYFVKTVLCMRTILNPDTMRAEGTVVLHKDEVKRKIGDRVEVLETLKNEADRVRAIEKYFFIALTPAEQKAIRGMPQELLETK
ncbi:N-acetyltransferase [Colletotrichum higginsianum]|uniref:N-acetyltransferase n=1 Tax=Colletotrichum higginsianum (strain IMI 349063) TaxID=759273 RepID=H1V274_COLHI|nr:N-acetyltransferase [Colletotrichum higginsianum IMI 349063]OBR05466.1 N-acetyltransferase [Colletotrichum higginsianum IMI 349063]CCF34326.1 N-acetyltransferase [Colletotrichum higginsianum]